MENKNIKVPVGSHGLSNHKFNFPSLTSCNFNEVFPIFMKPLEKGESLDVKGSVFSRLNPIVNAAFVTGRYNFKAVFVPYKFIFPAYYHVRTQTEWSVNTSTQLITSMPYMQYSTFNEAFLELFCLDISSSNPNNYEVDFITSGGVSYCIDPDNPLGYTVYRILVLLGYSPNFVMTDTTKINVLVLFSYLKAYLDYIVPVRYQNSGYISALRELFNRNVIDYSSLNNAKLILSALALSCYRFYDESIYDAAWNSPTMGNGNNFDPTFSFEDQSVMGNTYGQSNVYESTILNAFRVQNFRDNNTSPLNAAGVLPNSQPGNGTPFVAGGIKSAAASGYDYTSSGSAQGVLTQYIIDTLQSVTNWLRRRHISTRVLDRWLTEFGVKLPQDSAHVSYFLGERNVEMIVDAVENNSDQNLGELAGKCFAGTDNDPLHFSCNADDSGVFFVLCSVKPDCSFPVSVDPYNLRVSWDDFYLPEYDKLGCEAIPTRCVYNGPNGIANAVNKDAVFGFLNRYYADVQERPRLAGDFLLQSRGASSLNSYHSFRLFNPNSVYNLFMSYQFVDTQNDSKQYQRFFYSDVVDNCHLFVRWFGSSKQFKLPLGDSFDWDDDELNRKVSITMNGTPK